MPSKRIIEDTNELAVVRDALRRKSLAHFVHITTPRYEPPKHLAPMIALIERMLVEPVFALVSTPPRHGKTETLLHAMNWLLLNRPTARILYTTYESTLAWRKSRIARKYARGVGLRFAPGSRSVQEWNLVEGGGVTAVGLGGAITGLGFDFTFIDDPYKGRAEAESEITRESRWESFRNDVWTRKEPGGSVLVNMARWHEDDLIGRLSDQKIEGAPDWVRINLEALDDSVAPPKPLWPERWSVAELKQIRAQVGEYAWASLYMGNPAAREGNIFKRAWMNNRYDKYDAPKFNESARPTLITYTVNGKPVTVPVKYIVQFVDGAWKEGLGNDFSVILTLATDGVNFFIVDVWRQRVEYPELVKACVGEYSKYKPMVQLIENSASGIAVLQQLKRESIVPVVPLNQTQSKETRANISAPMFEAGRVWLPKNAPWVDKFINELCVFPNGAHDDQVDGVCGALERLIQQVSGSVYDIDGHGGSLPNLRSFYQR